MTTSTRRLEKIRWFFFTPLSPSGEDFDEETQDESLTVPRKVHYPNFGKDKRDVVHWVNLVHAQDLGLQFWQTKSNAVVVEEKEPPICICRVISLK